VFKEIKIIFTRYDFDLLFPVGCRTKTYNRIWSFGDDKLLEQKYFLDRNCRNEIFFSRIFFLTKKYLPLTSYRKLWPRSCYQISALTIHYRDCNLVQKSGHTFATTFQTYTIMGSRKNDNFVKTT
jgi:hypothetical protein